MPVAIDIVTTAGEESHPILAGARQETQPINNNLGLGTDIKEKLQKLGQKLSRINLKGKRKASGQGSKDDQDKARDSSDSATTIKPEKKKPPKLFFSCACAVNVDTDNGCACQVARQQGRPCPCKSGVCSDVRSGADCGQGGSNDMAGLIKDSKLEDVAQCAYQVGGKECMCCAVGPRPNFDGCCRLFTRVKSNVDEKIKVVAAKEARRKAPPVPQLPGSQEDNDEGLYDGA